MERPPALASRGGRALGARWRHGCGGLDARVERYLVRARCIPTLYGRHPAPTVSTDTCPPRSCSRPAFRTRPVRRPRPQWPPHAPCAKASSPMAPHAPCAKASSQSLITSPDTFQCWHRVVWRSRWSLDWSTAFTCLASCQGDLSFKLCSCLRRPHSVVTMPLQ